MHRRPSVLLGKNPIDFVLGWIFGQILAPIVDFSTISYPTRLLGRLIADVNIKLSNR